MSVTWQACIGLSVRGVFVVVHDVISCCFMTDDVRSPANGGEKLGVISSLPGLFDHAVRFRLKFLFYEWTGSQSAGNEMLGGACQISE